MAEPSRQYLFSNRQVRSAFVLSGIGMVSLIVGLLVLASSRPQGRLTPADTSEFEATLAAATEDLEGFERIGENRARIDIDTAIELVVERGVDLQLVSVESDQPPGDGATDAAAATDEGPQAQAALPDGAAVYATCSGCHMATGAGIPSAFPPLAVHAANLYNADGDLSGRDYLTQVLLQGLQGQIEVDGTVYNGLMPAWPQLSNGELAAVLNYLLTEWGNDDLIEGFEPYGADEIAAQRDADLGGAELIDIRGSLSLP